MVVQGQKDEVFATSDAAFTTAEALNKLLDVTGRIVDDLFAEGELKGIRSGEFKIVREGSYTDGLEQ